MSGSIRLHTVLLFILTCVKFSAIVSFTLRVSQVHQIATVLEWSVWSLNVGMRLLGQVKVDCEVNWQYWLMCPYLLFPNAFIYMPEDVTYLSRQTSITGWVLEKDLKHHNYDSCDSKQDQFKGVPCWYAISILEMCASYHYF